MKCARSTKDPLLVHYGLWLLHEGLIKTANEFEPLRIKLRRMNVDALRDEIARRKKSREVA